MARTNGPIQVWNRGDTIPTDAQGGYAGGDSTAAAVGTSLDQSSKALGTVDNLAVTASTLEYGQAASATISGAAPWKTIHVGIPKGMSQDVGQQLVTDAQTSADAAQQSAADVQTALQAQFMTQDEGVATLISSPAAGPLTRAALAEQVADVSFMSASGDQWEALTQTMAVSADRSRMKSLLAGSGSSVAVGRDGDDYDLYQEIADGRWWRMRLHYDSSPGEEHHSMWQSVIADAMGAHDVDSNEDEAAWSYTQVTGNLWIPTENQYAFGGTYARTEGADNYVTYTTPDGVTDIALHVYQTSNGGCAKVEVDGGLVDATGLPTAQDEVNAGRLNATDLTTGGGTLDPTDRLLIIYSPSTVAEYAPTVVTGMTPGFHSVKITATGVTPVGSSGTRLYLAGATVTVTGVAGADPSPTDTPLVELLYNSSVFEYAMTFTPTGGSSFPFIGNRHGNEYETGLSFEVDGAPVSLTSGQVVTGSRVVVTRDTALTQPDVAGDVATARTVYTMTPEGGLTVHATITWAVAGTARTSYLGMLPTQGNLCDKGRSAGGPTVTMLDDDDSVKGSTRSDTVALWDSNGNAAVMATIVNLPDAVNRWKGAPTDHAWLQDRSGGDFNKGYFQRIQSGASEPITAGDVWTLHINYRAAWLDDTSVLA